MALLAALALAAAMLVGASAPGSALGAEAPATFGKTNVGASSDAFTANRKRVSSYALPTAGAVAKLSIYLAPGATAGQQVLEGIIYGNSAAKPASLLGTTAPLTFSSSDAAGWYDLTFSTPLSLSAGTYWLGVITGPTGKVTRFRYDSVAKSRDYNFNTYTAGPSNPFGSVSTDSEQASLYATYTPAEAPPLMPPSNSSPPTISGTAATGQTLSASTGSWTESPTRYEYQWQRCSSGCAAVAGATASTYTVAGGDVGSTLRVAVTASNSAGASTPASSAPTAVVQRAPATFGKTNVGASSDVFAANRKRVSSYALPTAGAVSKLSIYLAPGGTAGQQVLEGIIYADASGKPGSLLGTTAPLTFGPDRHMGATADMIIGLQNGDYVPIAGPVNYGEASS